VLAGAFDVVIDRINRLFEVAMRVLNALLPPIMRIVSAFEKVAAVVQRVLNLISRIKIPNLSGLKPFANSAAVLTVAPTQVVYGATSPAGARSAVPPVSRGAASGGTVINITVNGALDPQSVSKQIARMLRVREGRVGLSSAAGLRA
jgi:hypothetical protein